MGQLFETLTESLSKRPHLALLFSVFLFAASLFYTKLKTSVIEADGHKLYPIGFVPQVVDGKTVYILVYKELNK